MPPKKAKAPSDPKKAPAKRNIVKSGNAGSAKSSQPSDQPPSEKKSLFGDWTGKTPVSLLHEHIQKQGWEKPVFDMARRKEGFLGTVQLQKRNKKTAQLQTVTLTPPTHMCQPTALEARHLAATFALHRINSHMPMYRVLPPPHRDYWHEFEKLKTKDNAWQFTPDPFGAQAPQAKASTVDRKPTKEHASAAVPMPMKSSTSSRVGSDRSNGGSNHHSNQMDEKMRKFWESLPAVHMSADNRTMVENVIKKSNLIYTTVKKALPAKERKEIRDGLVRMGFRPSHVDEALEYCSDIASGLDWLCLHVPEDDLPPAFMNANYNPTMTTVSRTTDSLGREWLLKRMSSSGYPIEACEEAMQMVGDDESKALELLQWRLVHGEEPLPEVDSGLDTEDLTVMRQEEVVALESIYESRFTNKSDAPDKLVLCVQLSAKLSPSARSREPLTLEVTIPKDSHYPSTLPIFTLDCDALPSYLKLAILKGIVQEAENNLGLPLIYMCTEWLQEHVDELIANPPRLRDVTENMAGLTAPKTPTKQAKPRRTNKPLKDDPVLSHELKQALEQLHASAEYAPFGKARANLPADKFKDKIVAALQKYQVTIVSGETGCGKTTQVPQFILDQEIANNKGSVCNIICTQPRKVAAIGVADRVAAERCEKVGQTVGYAVRGETKISGKTRLQFVTTGVLLRRLHSDPTLEGISHVLIDEVHERSVDSDFLLIILRRVLQKRRDLKVVLMSATINQELFSSYFDGAPTIQIPGFTHPVQDCYLEDIIKMSPFNSRMPMPKQDKEDRHGEWAKWQIELLNEGYDQNTVRTLARYRNQDKIDYDLVAHVVKHIVENEVLRIDSGAFPAILIFMPGAMEIRRCIESLQSALPSSYSYELLPLHANLSPQEQTRVFKPTASGSRKIVVATNVAETSITIDGVVYVIDSGRVKETQYDPTNNMMHLVETWASRASCKQRRGRAGRTRPGICYKLFMRHIENQKMHAQQAPELLRTPLEQLCLQVKAMGEHDVKAFLSLAIDPPSVQAMDSAIRTLQAVEAIDDSERGELTPLGKHMANIPADLRISKMLLLGSIFRCLDSVLTIAATMSLKSPFTSPMDRRDEAKKARAQFATGKSDWLTDMKAFDQWLQIIQTKGMREARQFCEENFLSFATLSEIQSLRRQYADALGDIGFYDRSQHEKYNINNANINLTKSVVFGGLNPNLARIQMPDTKYDKVLAGTVEREKEAREIKFFIKDEGRVFLHPSSILFDNNNYGSAFLTYFSRMATSKTFIRDGTEIPNYAVLFFGGRVDVDHLGRGLKVGQDGWIKFRAWARIGVLVNQLKRLLLAELDAKIQEPSVDVSASGVVQAMISLIANDGV